MANVKLNNIDVAKVMTNKVIDRAQQLVNATNNSYFGVVNGHIEFTGFVGKKGALAKFACAYVKAFLEEKQITGITYVAVDDIAKNGNVYTKDTWTVTGYDLTEVVRLFNKIATTGFDAYAKANPKTTK